MVCERDVRDRLNGIVDPCSAAAGAPAGLDDMGLIRKVLIELAPKGGIRLTVVIAVTEYGCLLGAAFAHSAYEILTNLADIEEVNVNLDSQFDWTPEDMTPAYRSRLASHRNRVRPAAAPVKVWPIKPEALASYTRDTE